MKVLIIRPFPERLNIDNYNVQEIGLANALIHKGHECGIVFYESGKNNSEQIITAENGKEIHIFWRKGINFLKNGLFFGLDNLIQAYDIIQVHEYDQLYSWYLYSFCQKPVVVYHGPYYNAFNKRYNMKTRLFDKIFLNNKNTKKATILTKSELASDYLRAKGFSNVKTVGVGLDSCKLVKEEASEDVRKIMESIKGYDSFLYVGKIEKRRNILFMLEVFAAVNNYHPCRLVLVGTGEEEYIKKVNERIAALGIEGSVVWKDRIAQSQLYHIYSSCKYFLFTTEYDIFGMVLLEAMYYGMIAFSSINGGSSTLITHGVNGFVFDKFDKSEWVKQIEMVLDSNNSEVSTNARDTIKEKYLWSSLADDFVTAYSKCIRE